MHSPALQSQLLRAGFSIHLHLNHKGQSSEDNKVPVWDRGERRFERGVKEASKEEIWTPVVAPSTILDPPRKSRNGSHPTWHDDQEGGQHFHDVNDCIWQLALVFSKPAQCLNPRDPSGRLELKKPLGQRRNVFTLTTRKSNGPHLSWGQRPPSSCTRLQAALWKVNPTTCLDAPQLYQASLKELRLTWTERQIRNAENNHKHSSSTTLSHFDVFI